MELKNTEKLEKSQVKLTVAVSAEELEAAKETAYKKNKNKISVPGFRKGKAPRKMIEKLYGEGVFLEDAINECFPSAFDFAMEQSGTKPIAQGNVDLGEITGAGFEFIITVPVEPEVAVSEYKGLEAAKETPVVTEEDIQQQMNVYIQRATTTETVDRAAENGDTAVIDFEGFVDGVAFEGGKGEKHPLKLGSGQFIPGFEEQLVGKKAGENVDVTVTFPEEYHAEDLKGKEAVFKCFVHEVQAEVVPELDDEFAKDVSEFDTIEELRADKRKKLEEAAALRAKNQRENELIEKACANASVEIPEAMIERQMDHILNDIRYRLSMQGISLEDYCKYTGTSIEDMRKEMRADAEKRVKSQLVLEAIGKAEAIEAGAEEIEEKLNEYAAQFGDKAESFKTGLTDEDKLYFADQIVLDKTIALLVDSAVEK